MDRNLKGVAGQDLYYVALRKESVDRNKAIILAARLLRVALRKESVDRNSTFPGS